MQNRKSAHSVLVIIVAAMSVIWLIRTQAPPKTSSVLPEPAEARIGPADIYPDPIRTPGAVNPNITQDNIIQTVCNPRWSTKSIRPAVAYTTRLKIEQIREYAYPDRKLRSYEEDHFIPLNLGGHPTDPQNLWPEPYRTSIPDGGARSKDQVEEYLRAQVCAGSLTLEQAQKEITEDWYRVFTTSVPH